MIIVPSLNGLAAALLKLLKDAGYWKPAEVRPPEPPLPTDDQFTSTDQVFYFFSLMNPTYQQWMHASALKSGVDALPRVSV